MSKNKTLGLAGNYMDTKETIHALKELEKAKFNYQSQSIHRAIELLQRGEKYEKIFNTILNWTMHDGDFIPVKELIKLEQKYFPKPSKNFTEKVMARINNEGEK